jgi:hypothetical protein
LQVVLTIEDVRRAAGGLDGVAHRTPVMTSRTLDAAVSGGNVGLRRFGELALAPGRVGR